MLVVVLLALRRALVADAGAELEHLAQNLGIGAGPPRRQLPGRLAHICAVRAGPDALRHVHRFGRAGIGAAEAHARTIHEMMRGIAERLVVMLLGSRVQRDHLANGHELRAPENLVENRSALAQFRLLGKNFRRRVLTSFR